MLILFLMLASSLITLFFLPQPFSSPPKAGGAEAVPAAAEHAPVSVLGSCLSLPLPCHADSCIFASFAE